MPPETRYARSGEINIAYQVVGDGPLDLVFVPGEWGLFAVDQVEAPASSQLVPDARERRLSYT